MKMRKKRNTIRPDERLSRKKKKKKRTDENATTIQKTNDFVSRSFEGIDIFQLCSQKKAYRRKQQK
jgi:hypothetical protein